MSNSHFCYWKSERWNSTLSSQFDWQHVRLWSARLHCTPQSCKSDSNQTFQCTSNNNVILWSVVELHMTCSHVKSSSVIESVIVESCQELCLPVSIADFLLNIKFLLCEFKDSMISQAITGKTIWDTWKICLNTMLDIGLLSLATKRKGQIHSGRSHCYTIKWVVQASKSMYCQYGPELLLVEWPILWRITINFLHNESIL